jgi:site-specific recombinase XerC
MHWPLAEQGRQAQVKDFFSKLSKSGLSRNTLRNTLCALREIFNHAIEDELIDRNPAARLGRFTRSESPSSRQLP